jgi:hypothetical protein
MAKRKSTKGQTTTYKIMYWNFLYLKYKLHVVSIVYHFNCLDDVRLIFRYRISKFFSRTVFLGLKSCYLNL